MTPAEALSKECEEITQRTGRYIPPYRMAILMNAANKVTDLIINKAGSFMNFEECQIILDIVSGTIKRCTGDPKDN